MRYVLTTKGVLRLSNRQSPGAMETLQSRLPNAPLDPEAHDLVVLYSVAQAQNDPVDVQFEIITWDSSPMTEDEVRRSMKRLFEHGYIDQVDDDEDSF